MPTDKFNFEQSLKELEAITEWFESGDANLDQGLVKFERGMELAKDLKAHLADIDNRVEKIKHKFAPSTVAAPTDEPPPEPAASESAPPPESRAPEPESDNQAGLFGA